MQPPSTLCAVGCCLRLAETCLDLRGKSHFNLTAEEGGK